MENTGNAVSGDTCNCSVDVPLRAKAADFLVRPARCVSCAGKHVLLLAMLRIKRAKHKPWRRLFSARGGLQDAFEVGLQI